MLSPEAELNAVVEKLGEPPSAEDPDHLSFREARGLLLTAITATRVLAHREHHGPVSHGPGECNRAKRAIDLAILDLHSGGGRAVSGNAL